MHYTAKQLFRAVCARGERAAAVHVDYSSAFDSLSHIYIYNSLKMAGASCKTLQLYKVIYQNAQVVTKVGASLSTPFGIGRGALEGAVSSPLIFNIGLEAIFREADGLRNSLALSDGIKLRDTAYSKTVFADDVTLLGNAGVADLTHRAQLLQHSSSKASLSVSVSKSCVQHIGHNSDAPAVTVQDIIALKPKHECPKPWCTRRFTTAAEVSSHVVWHEHGEGGG